MLIIYGKHKTYKRFSPMDMNNGVIVNNLMYATIYEDSDKERLQEAIEHLNKDNKDWTFKLRHVN